jgi:hypothetical protein
MEKKFSKFEIAAIKRTAANVSKDTIAKDKLIKKIEELTKEKEAIQKRIDAWQTPIIEMTGGYTTEDLVIRVVDKSGKNPITKFLFKYPDTIVPPTEEVPFEQPVEHKEENNVLIEDFNEF